MGRTFDLVFDAVGKSSLAACRPLLERDGLYISTELGRMAQNPILAVTSRLRRGPGVRFPLPTSTEEDMAYVRERLASGAFRPVLDDHHYRLDEIVDAYRCVETGRKVGNVVVVVGDEDS